MDQVLLHPDFQPLNYNNDIALLRLDRPVRFTGLIRPVCLPKPHGQVSQWPGHSYRPWMSIIKT